MNYSQSPDQPSCGVEFSPKNGKMENTEKAELSVFESIDFLESLESYKEKFSKKSRKELALYALGCATVYGVKYIWSKIKFDIQVPPNSDMNNAVILYFHKHKLFPEKSSTYNPCLMIKNSPGYEYYTTTYKDKKVKTKNDEGHSKFVLNPGQMNFWTSFKGVPIYVSLCNIKENEGKNTKLDFYQLKLTFFTLDHNVGEEFFAECYKIYNENYEKNQSVLIYEWCSSYNEYQKLQTKDKRSLDTVFIPEKQKDQLIEDLNKFIKLKNKYKKFQIPYQRGYLFYGQPGTGKTSTIHALASHFGYNICIIQLSTISNDSELANAFLETDANSMVILEDIDAINFQNLENRNQNLMSLNDKEVEIKQKTGITMSGLLNATNGITDVDGRILIMTTNHPEKLDPALIRSGRIDCKIEFKPACEEIAKNMYDHLTQDEDANFPSLNEIMQSREYPIAQCDLQNLILNEIKNLA